MQFINSFYTIVGPAMAVCLVILIIYSVLNPSKKKPAQTRNIDNNSDFNNALPNNDQERINEWKRQEELHKQADEKEDAKINTDKNKKDVKEKKLIL